MAALAEESRSPHGVAQVAASSCAASRSGRRWRARAGMRPTKYLEGNAGAETFSVNILFSSGEKLSISSVPQADRSRDLDARPNGNGPGCAL